MTNRYLLYISKNDSFEILRPLQQAIIARGDDCAWFVEGEETNQSNFKSDEKRLDSLQAAINYQPTAVFVPGNHVPNSISGLKVQVFHGLEWKKKGHFKIRGFFDLYCTHGPRTTERFNQLADEYQYFHVRETGWPKLDPLFQTEAFTLETDLPVILFAPTFSRRLTCALECLEEIQQIAAKRNYYWLVKFHPKMDPESVEKYRAIEQDNFRVVETDSVVPLLNRPDILLSDTSSIIGEFLLLGKPVVTYKNTHPGEYLIDVLSTDNIESALSSALSGSDELIEEIRAENERLHPYRDGRSSHRILEAVDQLLAAPIKLEKSKPLNLLRKFKLRQKLSYREP